MGSCFAETMGKKMKESKFDILTNPLGTLFHPLNLSDLLNLALSNQNVDPKGILEREGIFLHYSTHSSVFGNTREELLDKCERHLRLTRLYLEKTSHLVLTLGTAWLYEHKAFGRVANCHKQPQTHFKKVLPSLDKMERSLSDIFIHFSKVFPNLKIILTLSPVRHIKDGIPENQLSKSLLRVLCANLERELDSVFYFPAFEIMMDELRDYRFYKADRIHPSEEAEEYIWQKWQQASFSESTRARVAQIRKIHLELDHRPFHPNSPVYKNFLQNLLVKLERLHDEFDFSTEILAVKSRLGY